MAVWSSLRAAHRCAIGCVHGCEIGFSDDLAQVSVKRLFRVRENQRFQEIRRQGRSYSHDLLVLCALPTERPYSRFGFSVNSRIGSAVIRNRIKRRLREIVRLWMHQIRPGWDVVLIARRPIRSADYHQMEAACARLFRRAHLFLPNADLQLSLTDKAPVPPGESDD